MTFFSGTDTNTLRDEGQDRNNLVSLIVNNDGTYNAAITRLNKVVSHVVEEGTYEFFGEGPRNFTDEYTTEDSYVEYFMFNVVRKAPKGILGFIERIKEVVRKKPKTTTTTSNYGGGYGGSYYGYGSGYGSGYQKPSATVPAKPATPSYTSAPKPTTTPVAPQAPKPATPTPSSKPKDNNAATNLFWECEPLGEGVKKDPFIETLAVQLITGNMFAKATPAFDLDSWISKNMYQAYKERFGVNVGPHSEFRAYLDNILEYMVYSVTCNDLIGYSANEQADLIASMLDERLSQITSKNIYLNVIINSLKDYYDTSVLPASK